MSPIINSMRDRKNETMKEEKKIQEILDYYSGQSDRQEQSVIAEMLWELQKVQGFLSPELKECAAKAAGVNVSLIQILVNRYPSLKEADYEHEILACTGERCGRKEGLKVLAAIRKELGIKQDGLTADGRVMLKTQCCLKKCRTSPNFYLDGRLYKNVTPEQVSEILKESFR